MKQGDTTTSSLPSELPALAVLGISDPKTGDWVRVRGLQYSSLAQVTFARIVCHVVAAIATAALFIGMVPIAGMIAWFVALAATLYHAARGDASFADLDRRRLTKQEVSAHTVSSVINALVWVVPIAVFGLFADDVTQIKLWAVLAMLMTASAIIMPAVPLSTLVLTGIVGSGSIAYFLLNGAWDMAAVSAAFIVTIVAGTVESARRHLTAKIAQAGMAEKNEVVSLLLREFEEGEADWLWQVDTARRVRAVSPRFAFALGKRSEGSRRQAVHSDDRWTSLGDGTISPPVFTTSRSG